MTLLATSRNHEALLLILLRAPVSAVGQKSFLYSSTPRKQDWKLENWQWWCFLSGLCSVLSCYKQSIQWRASSIFLNMQQQLAYAGERKECCLPSPSFIYMRVKTLMTLLRYHYWGKRLYTGQPLVQHGFQNGIERHGTTLTLASWHWSCFCSFSIFWSCKTFQ